MATPRTSAPVDAPTDAAIFAPLALALPRPRRSGGRPFLDVIASRKSSRLFDPRPLPMQLLSDLLWTAFGISGENFEHRTAPSARNWREVGIAAVLADGAYRFDPFADTLEPMATGDLRAATGVQDFVARVPLNLVYIADFAAMTPATQEDCRFFSALDVGAICENVCLFCASEGLATVIRTSIDRAALAKALGLAHTMQIIAAQSVGYPRS